MQIAEVYCSIYERLVIMVTIPHQALISHVNRLTSETKIETVRRQFEKEARIVFELFCFSEIIVYSHKYYAYPFVCLVHAWHYRITSRSKT